MRVLVVDDNEAGRRLAAHLLAKLGHTAIFAANGQEAVDQCQAHMDTLDLVLMDIEMPQMRGDTAARIIRAVCSKDIPIIAISAWRLDLEDAANACFSDCLHKPYRQHQLEEILRRWHEDPTGSST